MNFSWEENQICHYLAQPSYSYSNFKIILLALSIAIVSNEAK